MPAKKKTTTSKRHPRAFRVDSWFTGTSGARGLQLAGAQPGWTMRGTFADRKHAVAHRKHLERTEHCSTRIVSVSA
jgi:hypothetical protein